MITSTCPYSRGKYERSTGVPVLFPNSQAILLVVNRQLCLAYLFLAHSGVTSGERQVRQYRLLDSLPRWIDMTICNRDVTFANHWYHDIIDTTTHLSINILQPWQILRKGKEGRRDPLRPRNKQTGST